MLTREDLQSIKDVIREETLTIKHDIKKITKDIKKINRDIRIISSSFDNDYLRLKTRVDQHINNHLSLSL
jgi:hypothetical protein